MSRPESGAQSHTDVFVRRTARGVARDGDAFPAETEADPDTAADAADADGRPVPDLLRPADVPAHRVARTAARRPERSAGRPGAAP
ncbi:hypothetical protein ABZX75_02755 [Streptomyces sp. NPDC003038]|uniref:hypothetical protein n=1 Tax=unclassified Streptomyces TaxID=2593676 RepID=UPI0033BD9DAE